MKALKAAFLFVVVLGVIAVGAASVWLGRGVKLALEKYGPGIVGAPVTVGSVVLTPWSGRGSITNLVIGNPPGFKGDHAVAIGAVEIKLDLSSLVTDTIVVESLVVREPEVLYEMSGSGNNLARLQKNAEGANAEPEKGAAAPAKPSKSLLIKEFTVTGGQVGLSVSELGAQGVKLPLPGIRMSSLGGKGRTPAEAASQALGAIASSAGQAVAGAGSKALNAAAASVMGKLGGLFKGK